MSDDEAKPFEEMTREELIAAATFWRGKYERVMSKPAVPTGFTLLWSGCLKCGWLHPLDWPCGVETPVSTVTFGG